MCTRHHIRHSVKFRNVQTSLWAVWACVVDGNMLYTLLRSSTQSRMSSEVTPAHTLRPCSRVRTTRPATNTTQILTQYFNYRERLCANKMSERTSVSNVVESLGQEIGRTCRGRTSIDTRERFWPDARRPSYRHRYHVSSWTVSSWTGLGIGLGLGLEWRSRNWRSRKCHVTATNDTHGYRSLLDASSTP